MASGDKQAEAAHEQTPLYQFHLAQGGKMVPFAGYSMPVQYAPGILKEHLHTRAAAGLFDVSHMGQVRLRGPDFETIAAALEMLVPGDIAGLAPGRMRYTQFTNAEGGILDDLMVTHGGDHLFLVVNAACKAADIAHLRDNLPDNITVEPDPDMALLALQGPRAAAVLADLGLATESMAFMTSRTTRLAGTACRISRSGYTGEDGFEIALAGAEAPALAERLVADQRVQPIGLGARDSLRLEAGLCLYGHDIDTETSPVAAGLAWSIGKRRREQGGFPGAERILGELADGPKRRRTGLRLNAPPPAREGAGVIDDQGAPVGTVTSGGIGPSVNGEGAAGSGRGAAIAMAYVDAEQATAGTALACLVRDKPRPAQVVKMPFVPHRYYRG